VLIFVSSTERAQNLFAELVYAHPTVPMEVLHASKSTSARDDAVAKFRVGKLWVLICTDLVSRGIDFKAVNLVINYDLPTSGSSGSGNTAYIHRIGRTGRAGRKGTAITLFTESDFGDGLKGICNVMKLSGGVVPDWMTTKLQHLQRRPKKDYHVTAPQQNNRRSRTNSSTPKRKRSKQNAS